MSEGSVPQPGASRQFLRHVSVWSRPFVFRSYPLSPPFLFCSSPLSLPGVSGFANEGHLRYTDPEKRGGAGLVRDWSGPGAYRREWVPGLPGHGGRLAGAIPWESPSELAVEVTLPGAW